MNTNRYKKIANINYTSFSNLTINTYIPTPSKSDYEAGYIRRYFLKKINDNNSPIYEVNQIEFSRILSKPIYGGVTVKWRITGPISETFTNSVIDKGVKESNRIAIELVADKMPNLKFYLPNLLQFHK